VIVVDASALVDWLLATPGRAQEISRRLRDGGRAHTLDLGHVEAVSAIRRLTGGEGIDRERARAMVWVLMRAPFRRHPATPLLGRVWELRDSHSAYDAAHLALAERLEVPLLTSDHRLARSGGHRASVIDAAG